MAKLGPKQTIGSKIMAIFATPFQLWVGFVLEFDCSANLRLLGSLFGEHLRPNGFYGLVGNLIILEPNEVVTG